MEPTYSEKDLEKLKGENHKFEFEGKEYDGYTATQKQREIERTIRKLKRRKVAFEAAGQEQEAQAASIKMRLLRQKYKNFSKAAGLSEQIERMKVLYQ